MNRRKAVSNFMFAIIIVCFAAKLKPFDSFLVSTLLFSRQREEQYLKRKHVNGEVEDSNQ